MPAIRLRDYEVDRLPMVCMRCGAPAKTEVARKFSWYPPWIAVTILAGLLVYVILALVLTKRMLVRVPLCTQHRNHWFSRALFTWIGAFLLLFVGLFAFVFLIAQSEAGRRAGGAPDSNLLGFICVGWSLVFLAFLIVALVLQSQSIRPTEITERSITLTNVSLDFIDVVEKADFDADRGRRRRRSLDDPEERRGPPPLPSDYNDGIREDSPRPRRSDGEDDDRFEDRSRR